MNITQVKSQIEGGVLPAMATPLQEDRYRVNLDVLAQLIDFLILSGVKGLFVGGTTGEGILLSAEQRKLLHAETMRLVDGRVPVILHVGANTTAETADLAAHAQSTGVLAIAAVTPYYYPMHDDALLAYYQQIAAAAPETALLGYDIPQMAVNGIGPALLTRLAAEIPTFVGVKSSQQSAPIVGQLVSQAPAHTVVLTGYEATALGLVSLGSDGLISGLATAVPEPFVALLEAFSAGDIREARRQQRAINEILALLPAGARIGAIKAILAQRGIPVGQPVPPRPMPDAGWQAWPRIEAILEKLTNYR